jgi:ABC-type cobalamin/Fe3+-siderophores transport system ATPase subunit
MNGRGTNAVPAADAVPVSLQGFSIFLGERPLVTGVDFAPARGSSSVVIGPTGVGKSVLLKSTCRAGRPVTRDGRRSWSAASCSCPRRARRP